MLSDISLFFQTIPWIYLAWVVLSYLGFIPVFLLLNKKDDRIGFAYLATSILKMILALTAVLPILLDPDEKTEVFALNFVLVFFFVLAVEVFYFLKVQKSLEKSGS